MDAVTHIQKRFYQDFPPHPSEPEYQFATPSTMKPTIIRVSNIMHAMFSYVARSEVFLDIFSVKGM